mgnify:CR=1 FL=1
MYYIAICEDNAPQRDYEEMLIKRWAKNRKSFHYPNSNTLILSHTNEKLLLGHKTAIVGKMERANRPLSNFYVGFTILQKALSGLQSFFLLHCRKCGSKHQL